MITHFNIPLSQGERRDSWVCYTAGGLMRWVAAGNKSVERMKEACDMQGLRAYEKRASEYLEKGWASLLDVSGVAAYHRIPVASTYYRSMF